MAWDLHIFLFDASSLKVLFHKILTIFYLLAYDATYGKSPRDLVSYCIERGDWSIIL